MGDVPTGLQLVSGTGEVRAGYAGREDDMGVGVQPGRALQWGRLAGPPRVWGQIRDFRPDTVIDKEFAELFNEAMVKSENDFTGPKWPTKQCNHFSFREKCHKHDRIGQKG